MQMESLAKLPSKVWVSLLWSQYNRLSEPLKEGFVNLAHSVAKEAGNTDKLAPCVEKKDYSLEQT